MKLYTYWRSTAAYRVRIALGLKRCDVEQVPVHLTRGGGEQHAPDYVALNPTRSVPTLVTDDGTAITQSLAILEWLEERIPEPALLPRDPDARARIRSLALTIVADVHPINNLRVGAHLKSAYGRSQDEVVGWMRHWMTLGLGAYQAMIEPGARFSVGDTPTFADICLVPQLFNARRWQLDMSGLEPLAAIERRCLELPAFAAAAPERQPDAE